MDSELDLVHRLEIERHLQACSECADSLHDGRVVQTALRSEHLYHAAPTGLEGRVLTAVRTAERAQQRPARRFLRPAFGTAAFACFIMVLWVVFAQVPRARREEAVTHQVTSSHVHSLMAAHLLDVASSDPGLIKPWLNAKLNFPPPIPDLKSENYTLQGGRLDYVEDHPVAALIYTRRKHVINLFLWPSAEPASQMVYQGSRQGYRLCGWTAGGMTYWAVSDVGAPEMMFFAEAVQAHTTMVGTPERCE